MSNEINPVFTDEWESMQQIRERTQLPHNIIKRARRLAMAAGLVAKRLVGKAEVPQYRRLCR